MAKYRLLTVTGSVPTYVKRLPPVTSSGDLNVIRSKEKKTYTRLLLGTAKMSEVGESGPKGSDPTTQPATPPSWTQSKIGVNHAYSLSPFSSSEYPVRNLNCFYSGSQPLELSAVPASQSLFYEKGRRYVKLIYKMSASFFTPQIPSNYTYSDSFNGSVITTGTIPKPCAAEIPSGASRANFIAVSGAYQDQTVISPAIYEIFVPEYGKIRDIRVWFEFISDARMPVNISGEGTGVGIYTIALQSPNVHFKYGRPLWNDPRSFAYQGIPLANGISNNYFPAVYENSYVLWDGSYVGIVSSQYANFTTGITNSYGLTGSYPTWNSDLDMRTIFSDAGTSTCPLDQSPVRDASGLVSVGNLNYLSASAPNTVALNQIGQGSKASVTGANIPWMFDTRIKTASLPTGITFTPIPPNGWLTGPSFTAGTNEFPTTGQSFGPNVIRPLYPLLDDVYEKLTVPAVGSTLPAVHPSLIGFRPGLRGTEIHGTWRLKMGTWTADYPSGSAGFNPGTGSLGGWWFRQFRLEFTVDIGADPTYSTNSKRRRFDIPSHVERGQVDGGLNKISVLSGSAAWSLGTNIVYSAAPSSTYGRSIGISSATGSAPNFAVFSRLTGALASVIGENPSFYLNNEFGTPYIPISSGSSVPQNSQLLSQMSDADVASRDLVKQIVLPTTLIPQANTLRAALARTDYSRTMMDRVAIALSTISGSS